MKTEENTQTYTGIADCHGIESFNLKENMNQSILSIRANANDQRHAVVYEADMTDKFKDGVMRLLNTGNYGDALNVMRVTASELRVAGGARGAKMFLKLPNPELDPWA